MSNDVAVWVSTFTTSHGLYCYCISKWLFQSLIQQLKAPSRDNSSFSI